jgi:hypothetical protein
MRYLFFLLVLLLPSTLMAQSRTHLPYSIFGVGELNTKGFGRNMGMGNSGIAMSSGVYLNNQNPAAYHMLDSISFFFDFGLQADFVTYKTSSASQQGKDINLRNLALGFRINKHWSAGIGILPFSTVGYKIVSDGYVEGTTDLFTAELTGSGGLNQFYWDNSYRLLNNRLSLGINASYVFGNIESSENIHYEKFTNDIISKQISRVNKVLLDFGFQYFFPINTKSQISIGGIFGNSHNMNLKQQINISESDGSVIEDKITRTGFFNFPMYYGGGLSYTHSNKLTVNADYIFHDWSATVSEKPGFNYKNTNTYRFGIEYIPGKVSQYGYFGSVSYRAGYYYEGSYMEIDNVSIADKGITLGLGLPFLKNKSTINLTYKLGMKGSLENGLIKESYNSIVFNLSMHDWWFIKPKYD